MRSVFFASCCHHSPSEFIRVWCNVNRHIKVVLSAYEIQDLKGKEISRQDPEDKNEWIQHFEDISMACIC